MEENVTALPTKGFELPYKAFENTMHFVTGMQKAFNCAKYPTMKSTYRIKRLCDTLEQELRVYQELRKKIDLQADDCSKKLEELHEISVAIKWNPLSLEELECITGTSPSDLMALEFIADPKAFEKLLT